MLAKHIGLFHGKLDEYLMDADFVAQKRNLYHAKQEVVASPAQVQVNILTSHAVYFQPINNISQVYILTWMEELIKFKFVSFSLTFYRFFSPVYRLRCFHGASELEETLCRAFHCRAGSHNQ